MSAEAVAWAWKQEVGGNEKLVLLALAEHAHMDGTACWPGIERISGMVGVETRRTTERHLATLEDKGLIVRESGKARGKTNRYVLPLAPHAVFTRAERAERKQPERPADPLWDALARETPPPQTKTERAKWNVALAQMREANVQPEEVKPLCDSYRRTWPGITLTPMGMVGNLSLIRASARPLRPVGPPPCEECGVAGHTADCSQAT